MESGKITYYKNVNMQNLNYIEDVGDYVNVFNIRDLHKLTVVANLILTATTASTH